jgi:hypothetical protein
MLGVRETPNLRRASATQAVVLRPAGGIVYASGPTRRDRMCEALQSRHSSRRTLPPPFTYHRQRIRRVFANARCIEGVMRNTSENPIAFVVGRRIENRTVAPRLAQSPSMRRS